MTSYMLCYDVSTTFAIREQLTAFVKNNRHIIQWGHPFSGCYLFKSQAAMLEITEAFREFFAGKTLHIILPVEGHETSGILPTNFWEWLNQTQVQPLGGLLGLTPPKFSP